MLDYTKKVFVKQNQVLQSDCKIVIVADMFAADYEGGAELTTEAIIEASPYKVQKIRSNELNSDMIISGLDKHWIFGNFSQVNPNLLSLVIQKLKYSVLEYDYKFCKHRSVEKHLSVEGKACDCHINHKFGQLVLQLYSQAQNVFWMSEAQRDRYFYFFPALKNKSKHTVLSSVFSKKHLSAIANLRTKYENKKNGRAVILGSNSWIKGFEDARKMCEYNCTEYDVLWNVPYDQALDKLAQASKFVYLPKGGDTCPRMVIEAKLLGCEVVTNEHVQMTREEFFSTDNLETTYEYLSNSALRFWNIINFNDEKQNSINISGYTQTRNCIEQDYPWEEAISSLLGFCDEVVIVDGGSTDGTWERLQEISKLDARVKPFQCIRDWNDKRFALFNGQQKAEARARCKGEFLWQIDIDEVIHESDYDKIKQMTTMFPKEVSLLALPVIEYWGSDMKMRVDVNPWKWRLSRNDPRITHGLPKDQRLFDSEGTMYSAGSDGDDYIYKDTLERVPYATFYTPEIDQMRNAALQGNKQALDAYKNWVNTTCVNVPGVYHYSWYNLERKIKTYSGFWSRHWSSLYNKVQDDTAENNKFFNKPWSQVTDAEIKKLAQDMKEKMGGWIFHNRIDFSRPTPWVTPTKSQPACMANWTKQQQV